MPGFVVTAVFELDGGRVGSGRDVLAALWGRGHRFSFWDGRRLSLVADVTAPDRSEAFDAVLTKAGQLWARLDGAVLPVPFLLRVEQLAPQLRACGGAVGRGPDSLIADSAARVAARLRATRAALAELEGLG